MIDTTIQDSRIEINGTTHELKYEIADVITTDRKVIVLISVPTGEICNQNIVCFTKNGDRSWQVDELQSDREDKPFVSIQFDNEELIADNWIGVRASIDLETGAITNTSLSK